MTIWEARNLGVKQLQHSQNASNGRLVFSTPTLDCDCLLSHVLEKERSFLLAHNQDFLDSDYEAVFFNLVKKRSEGTPIAYLVGKKEFYGFDFFVSDAVLIPKPDTEILVEKAIELLEEHFLKFNIPFTFADICTGSGCIAVSVLRIVQEKFSPTCAPMNLTCHCVDISKQALDVARKNAISLLTLDEKNSIQFFQGDLLEPLQEYGKYDMIVSNPPYIPSSIVDELLQDGRGEPRLALDGDVDNTESSNGFSIIERLIPQAWKSLKDGGFFLIETGEYNAFETLQLMKKIGFVDCKTFEDLAGQPRVSYGKKQ